MKLRVLLVIVLMPWFLVSCKFNGKVGASNLENWRSRQLVWWKDDVLIKKAILSGISLRARYPRLTNDEVGDEHFSDVGEMLLLFDSMSSDRSIRTLASLAPYYLGSSTDEIYSCLVIRKGKTINKFLVDLKNSDSDECINTFKRAYKHDIGKVCLSSDAYKEKLTTLIESINKNRSCTIEQ